MRGSVVKKGTCWYVVVEDRDAETGRRKRRWHSGYRTKRDAQAACSELLASLHRGDYVAPNRQTVAEFAAEWLDAIRATIRPSTMDKYRRDVRAHVLPYIGHLLLARLDATTLNRLWATLAETGRKPRSVDGSPSGLSSKSIENVAMTVHRMLKDAVRWGRLARNPADAADPPRRSVKARQVQACDAETLRRFLGECRAVNDPLYPLWVFLATTGLRPGEALGLHWAEVDLASGRVGITHTLGSIKWKLVAGQPKTSAGRRPIALDPTTASVLRDHRRRMLEQRLLVGAGFVDQDYVFCEPDGSPLPRACLPSIQATSSQAPGAVPLPPRPAAHVGDDRPRQRCPSPSGAGASRPRPHLDHVADVLARSTDDARRGRSPRRQSRSPGGLRTPHGIRDFIRALREYETRSPDEDGVCRHDRRVDVDRAGSDPQIVAVDPVGEWMAGASARRTQFCHRREQSVADWNHCGRGDRLLHPLASRSTPLGDDGSIAQFCHRGGREEDLIAAERSDLRLEHVARSATQRGAEDPRINDKSHDEMAAANASASASERSSIKSRSTEARVGAPASCSGVRSLGIRLTPRGSPPGTRAASLMRAIVTPRRRHAQDVTERGQNRDSPTARKFQPVEDR